MNKSAFISEIAGSGLNEELGDEYLEITILKSENLSDYTVGFYDEQGNLEVWGTTSTGGQPGSSFFQNQSEITLQEIFDATGGLGSAATTLGGLDMSVITHPDFSQYYLITLPASFTGSPRDHSIEAVSLYNTATNDLIDAYSVGSQSTASFQNGVAAGNTPELSGATSGADSRYNSEGEYVGEGLSGRTFGHSQIVNPISAVVCFTSGSLFSTQAGEKRADELEIGEMVETLDNGFQPIRFIYKREVAALGEHRPVVIAKGTIGNTSEMIVSQRHRIYTKDIPGLPNTYKDHLIEAQEMINNAQIRLAEATGTVTYYHVMFDKHEIINVDGAFSESWQPHKRNLKRDAALREELMTIFPELADDTSSVDGAPVRQTISVGRRADS